MKKLLTILIAVFLSVQIFAQSSPTLDLRIANATTAFGQNLPIGTKVFNVDTGLYYVATAGVLSTATLTSAAASFDPIITRVWATTPIRSSGGGRPVITIQPASVDSAGSLSALDKVKIDSIRANLLLYERLANKSTNVTTDGASDIKYPSTKAVKTYTDLADASADTLNVHKAGTQTVTGKKTFSNIAALTTSAESWIGPSSTTGVYFKENNAGFGTTNPVAKLEVSALDADDPKIIISGTSGLKRIRFGDAGSGNTGSLQLFDNHGVAYGFINERIDHNLEIYGFDGVSAYTNILLGVDGTTTNAGKVGIGVASPTEVLSIASSALAISLKGDNSNWKTRFTSGISSSLYTANYQPYSPATQDDASVSSWIMELSPGSDKFYLSRTPAGSTTVSTFLTILGTGLMGIGTVSPTAVLQLKAGTATASTAPLKFTQGVKLTTPEVGAMEIDTTSIYYTSSTWKGRRTFAFLESPTFTDTVTVPLLNFSKAGYGAYKAMISDAAGNIAYSRALGNMAYKDSTYFQTNLTSPVTGMIGTGDRLVYTTAAGVLTPTAITLSGGILNYGGTKTFSNAFDLVSREYVDATTTELAPKLPCDLATTTGQNLDLAGVETIDGTATTSGTTRVLVKNQTTVAQNGVYIAQAGAWTRSTDLDTWAELYKAYVVVSGGSANVGTSWICTIPSSGTLEVTDVTWQQFGIANTITAGIGLQRTGDDIHANVDESTVTISSDTIRLKAMTSAIFGAKISDETGTDKLVYNTNPTLVTPILGTPQSGNFSTGSFTWPTFNQTTTGTAAGLTAAYIDYNSSSGGNSILNKPDLTIYHLKDDSLKRHTNLTTTAHGGIVALADSANGSGAAAKWVTGKAFNTHAALNATTSTNGHLSSTDWNTFNGKQAALVSTTNIKSVNGTTLLGSGDLGIITGQYGGTGIANTGKTITIGGNFSTVGAYTAAFTMTGNTAVTFPTSGTLATTSQLTGAIVYICESFEIPADGSTGSTVTLGHTPLNVSGVTVSQNGAELKYTDQFTVSGTTVTFAKQVYAYDKITASYTY